MAVIFNSSKGKELVPTVKEVEKRLEEKFSDYVSKSGGEFTGEITIPERGDTFSLIDLRDKYPATEKQLKLGVDYALSKAQELYAKKDHGHTIATKEAAGFMSTKSVAKLEEAAGNLWTIQKFNPPVLDTWGGGRHCIKLA